MPMTPMDRKVELMRREKKLTDIAKQLEVSVNHVSQVVAGKRRSPRVEEAVAQVLGKPVTQVFEPSQTVAA